MTRSWAEPDLTDLGEDGDDRIWVGLQQRVPDTVDGGAGNDISDGDAEDVLSNVESVLA